MRQGGMVARHFLRRDKMHLGVIVRKIGGHRADRASDRGEVRPRRRHDIAHAAVHLARRERRHLAAPHGGERIDDGQRVRPRVRDAGDAPRCVRMTLADPCAPKGVGRSLWQYRLGVQPRKREEARVPPRRDQCDLAARAGGGIHGGKMHRNLRMRVKAVHHAKVAGKLRRLPRQVVRAAAAEDQRVDLTLVRRSAVRRIDGHAVRHAAERGGVAPCKDPAELHIRRRHRCRRSAAPEIAVAENCNSQHKKRSFA